MEKTLILQENIKQESSGQQVQNCKSEIHHPSAYIKADVKQEESIMHCFKEEPEDDKDLTIKYVLSETENYKIDIEEDDIKGSFDNSILSCSSIFEENITSTSKEEMKTPVTDCRNLAGSSNPGENSDNEKQYFQPGNLKTDFHLNIDNKKFRCRICGKTFSSFDSVKSHVNGIHKDLRYYFCDLCKNMFLSLLSLKKHIDTVHNGKKHVDSTNFKCVVCGKTFSHFLSLKVHLNGIHKDIKHYSCLLCKDVFSSFLSLENHIHAIHSDKKHINSRKFRCAICSKIFSCFDSLKGHINGIHKN